MVLGLLLCGLLVSNCAGSAYDNVPSIGVVWRQSGAIDSFLEKIICLLMRNSVAIMQNLFLAVPFALNYEKPKFLKVLWSKSFVCGFASCYYDCSHGDSEIYGKIL